MVIGAPREDTEGESRKRAALRARADQAPHRERLRCALACAHAARRMYEYRRPGDHRLRPALVLISEIAAAGSRAKSTVTPARLSRALQTLREASQGADTVSALVLTTTMDAIEAALAVLNHKPWRLVDEHARRAYMRADHALSQSFVEAAYRGPEAVLALARALDGQDQRAFDHARALWLPSSELVESAPDLPAPHDGEPDTTPAP